MSTRSRIGYIREDGSVISIFSHWDGYPKNNGDILKRFYTKPSKVRRLVNLGSISSLHEHLSTSKPHSFDRPNPCVTVAYFRDRGDPWENCTPRIDQDVDHFVHGDVQEWGYLFKDGEWFIVDGHAEREYRQLIPLTDEIIEANDIV